MKLLIITQKVDKNDDLLGFFHGWIKAFAAKVDFVTVICLQMGRYDLPQNVKVISLGKESGHSRLKYLFNFYRNIWRERKNYDTIFVHMNKEYVLLGGIIWKLLGKKIGLWYIHKKAGLSLKIVMFLCDIIFTASKGSFPFKNVKVKTVGHGIDTEVFQSFNTHNQKNILFLGRISPIKDPETLIRAFSVLKRNIDDLFLNIVGGPAENNVAYSKKIINLVSELGLTDYIKFWGSLSYKDMGKIYNQNGLFVNLTVTGSFDKAALEAMACGLPVFACNEGFLEIFGRFKDLLTFKERDIDDLVKKITIFIALPEGQKSEISDYLRREVVKNHNLAGLIDKITFNFGELRKN